MNQPTYRTGTLLALASVSALIFAAIGCSEAQGSSANVAGSQAALDLDDAKEVAKECGLVCPGDTTKDGVKVRGVAEGNAAIAGVSSVDAFFASVLHFQASAQSVADGIDEQVAAIRSDFGLAADADILTELKARFDAQAQAGVKIEHEPARCSADVKATLAAQARCDSSFDPGKAMLSCKGDCELDASATAGCEAQSDLECTLNAPSISCDGVCRGNCEASLTAAAACDGTCRGSCDGTCSSYVMDASGTAQCAGQCSGMCTGSCETQLAGTASCSGKCKGECVVMNPSGGCTGAISMKCKAKANAMLMCSGRCDSDFEPPKARVECQASVKADTKCHMHCTPPRVVARYRARADASIGAAERARFDAAVKLLAEVRLPALLAQRQQGTLVVQAGTELASAAQGAVKGAVNETLSGKLSVQEAFGLGCAIGELPKVDSIVSTSNKRLNQSLDTATALTAMLGADMYTGDNTMKRCMRFAVLLGLLCACSGMSACGKDDLKNALDDDTLNKTKDKVADTVNDVAGEVAKACGLGCPGDQVGGVKVRGIVDGNAAISGVAQVDTFFESVLNYRSAAGNVNAGIEAQLAAIRADFGMAADADVAAELEAQVASYVDGAIRVQAEPARCEVDAMATVNAAARCDTSIDPGNAMVECKGACEVDASASAACDANATLVCELSGPAVQCDGMCEGSCQVQLTAAAKCAGTCTGTCGGTCSAYSDAAGTQCAGECTGDCTGSCETQVMAGASCKGMCRGTCTVQNPSGGCQASAHAECQAKANASVMCRGRCRGDFEPPKVKAECQASAKCEASLNVQCTPPQLVLAYKLKSGGTVDTAAQARFSAAIDNLHKVRLPALLQAAAQADFVARAGENLVSSAEGAVKGSVDAALKGDLSVRASFGLACAVKELPRVKPALDEPNERLNENLMSCQRVRHVLGMDG